MTACDLERLEQLVLGELARAEADEVAAHSRTCDDCATELALLRSERAVFAARAAALANVVMVAPAAPPRPAPPATTRFPWLAATGMALALAAAVLFYVRRPAIVAPREPAAPAAIAADPAAQEMCEDDGFVHEPKSPLECRESSLDSGVTNECRSPLSP